MANTVSSASVFDTPPPSPATFLQLARLMHQSSGKDATQTFCLRREGRGKKVVAVSQSMNDVAVTYFSRHSSSSSRSTLRFPSLVSARFFPACSRYQNPQSYLPYCSRATTLPSLLKKEAEQQAQPISTSGSQASFEAVQVVPFHF